MRFFRVTIPVFLLCFIFCGCSAGGGSVENDRKFMVAALGFDNEGGMIKLSAETIIINSETADAAPAPQVITGTGRTVSEALDDVCDGLSKPLILNHCGVIAIGESITPEQLDKIFEYCFSDNRITLSAYVIASEDCESLLSVEPVSTVAVGYEIMGIIEQHIEQTGVKLGSKFFETEAERGRPADTFALPFLKKDESKLIIEGADIYRNGTLALRLSPAETSLYSLITGKFFKGKLRIDDDIFFIRSRSTDYSFNGKSGGEIVLKLQLSGDKLSGKRLESLENELENFELRIKNRAGADIFGFENLIAEREHKLWLGIKENYGGFYRDCTFTVKCSAYLEGKK